MKKYLQFLLALVIGCIMLGELWAESVGNPPIINKTFPANALPTSNANNNPFNGINPLDKQEAAAEDANPIIVPPTNTAMSNMANGGSQAGVSNNMPYQASATHSNNNLVGNSTATLNANPNQNLAITKNSLQQNTAFNTKVSNSFQELSKVIDENGNTVAHQYALSNPNWVSQDPKVLLLTNKVGISVAYWLAYRQEIPTEYVEGGTPEVLNVVKLYQENKGLNTKPNWQTSNEEVLASTYNGLSVAHLLALNNPMWQTNSTKILLLGAENNWTVAHVLAKNNSHWQSDSLPILSQPDANGWTVAHLLARYNKNWSTNNKQVLMLEGKNGITVAHVLAMRHNGWQTKDPTILKLAEANGWTVAHSLAKNNSTWNTEDSNILKLSTTDGLSVAHLLARGHYNWVTKDKSILMLSMANGRTVAHELGRYNPRWITQDKDLLVLIDEEGFSLAHIFVRKNRRWQTKDPMILSLKDRNGDSVAHYLARRQYWNTSNPDILGLTNNAGVSVQDIINKR